jgi:hypothetical protein
MTKQEFNKRINKVIDKLSKDSDFSCLEVKQIVGRKSRRLYSNIFQPSHFDIGSTWIIEDHGFSYDMNRRKLRINMVELFRQKCLAEKLYLGL